MISDAEKTVQRIEQTLLGAIARQGLFLSGSRVIAACSGGADSMALLLFLLRNADRLQITVQAAHVNHGLRGAAADADAAFVAAFCRQHGVKLHLLDAAREGISIPPHASENWARGLRYTWFDRLARENDAVIATAHTMSDQAETMLFRMARGTGLHGLTGMAPQRGCYRRPFLCLRRADTESYCAALGQRYMQDETNAEDFYARNRIRHDAVPALEYANPAALQAMSRLSEQLRTLDVWLEKLADTLLQQAAVPGGYDAAKLAAAPEPVVKTALHKLVSPTRDAEEKYLALLYGALLQGSGGVQLTADTLWRVENGTLFLQPNVPETPEPMPAQPFRLGKFCLPGGYTVVFEAVKYENFLNNPTFSKKDLNCCADCDRILSYTVLRTRQPGDFFQPAGRCRKTLKKYYNENKVPQPQRALLPLLAKGSEVVWLWGSGFAEGYTPTVHTQTVLTVRAEKE